MKRTFVQSFTTGVLALALVVSPLGSAGGPAAVHAAEQGISQPYESIFAGDRIIDVKVTIEEEDWESILANPLDKDYKSVTVEVDGEALDNVGFSTKGNSTLRAVAGMEDSDRYSFRLKFDKFDKSQTLLGLDKMVLNNNYSDPSYLREYLHYEALREIGMDAPQTVFANLYINGELFGFFTGVESVDDSYLLRNYGEDYKNGVLYEAAQGTTLLAEADEAYDTLTEDLGSDPDKALLRQFITTLNEMPAGEQGDIESVLNVDSALQYIAANMALGNYDSYNGSMGHNFMLYSDAEGVFTVVPWDYNMSFGGFAGGGRQGGGTSQTGVSAITVPIDEPVLGIDIERVPLINNLLQVPEYKAQYESYVRELVDYLSGIQERIDELAVLIRPSVEADPTKFYTMEQFESNLIYNPDEQPATGMMGSGQGMIPPGDMGNWPPAIGPGGSAEGLPQGWRDGSPAESADGGPPTGWGAPPAEGGSEDSGRDGNGRPAGGIAGGGMMTAGSLTTFALNRLANLQEQLGLEVIALPQSELAEPGEDDTARADDRATADAADAAADPAGEGIAVTLDGQTVAFADQQLVLVNGTLFVPVRELVAALSGAIYWDGAARTVNVRTLGSDLTLTIGKPSVIKDGQTVTLPAAPSLLGNRTMVPVHLLTDVLGVETIWDQASLQLTLTTPAQDSGAA